MNNTRLENNGSNPLENMYYIRVNKVKKKKIIGLFSTDAIKYNQFVILNYYFYERNKEINFYLILHILKFRR